MDEKDVKEWEEKVREMWRKELGRELDNVERIGGVKEGWGRWIVCELGGEMKMFIRGGGLVWWWGVKGGNEERGGKMK